MAKQDRADSPPLSTGMRAMLLTAAVLVLLIGLPVFLYPARTDEFFAWTINSPIMAASLGASYLAASVLEAAAARARSWAEARIAVPTVLTFTTLTLLVTLVHLERFHLHAPSAQARAIAWVWLVVYAIVPLFLGALWFRQVRGLGRDSGRGAPIPASLRKAWIVLAMAVLPLGACLLVAPTWAASIWPWPLTALTGRATGAWLVGFGVLSAHAAIENDLTRLRPVFPAVTVFAGLQAIVLARFGGGLNWTRLSPWIYALFILAWLVTGLGAWRAAIRSGQSANATARAR